MVDTSIKHIVAKDLFNEIGCCARCALRFIGEKSRFAYINPAQTLAQLSLKDPGTDKCENNEETQDISNNVCMESKNCVPSNVNTVTVNHKTICNSITNNDGSCSDSCSDVNSRIICNSINAVELNCPSCLGVLEKGFEDSVVQKVLDEVENSGHEFDSFALSISMPLSLLVWEHSLWLFLQEKYSSFYGSYKLSAFVPSVKEVLKWVCGPLLERSFAIAFQPLSPFQISLTFDYDGSVKDLDFLSEVEPSVCQPRKKRKMDKAMPRITAQKIQKAVQELSTAETFRKFSSCPPKRSMNKCQCTEVSCFHGQLFLAGRYNKYSRTLPQSPWLVDGKRHAESSVQEKICESVKKKLKGDDYRFSSAGREDIDVRMLGKGRPFIIEVINPKIIHHSRASLRELQNDINTSNSDIRIRDLQIVTRENCAILKEAELNKTKSYSALIWAAKEITEEDLKIIQDVKDLKLYQNTPLRVLHRRPLAVRERVVHSMRTEWMDQHHFRLFLKTQAGTYIKEFVHSDFGRTQPNLGTLLETETDILELDVESVDVNWPSSVDEE